MGESIAQRLQRPQRGNGGLDRGGSLREHRGSLRARNARNGESIAQRSQRPQRGNGGLDRGGSFRERGVGFRARKKPRLFFTGVFPNSLEPYPKSPSVTSVASVRCFPPLHLFLAQKPRCPCDGQRIAFLAEAT